MSERMNVLHIIADQHHADCMGHAGHPQVISPNLDRLAASGVSFTRCYTQNTICTPSRVSLISGQYCHNHGFYGLYGPRPDWLPGSFSRLIPSSPRLSRPTSRSTNVFRSQGRPSPHHWAVRETATSRSGKGRADK